jgi:peptidoglycan/xylan/chitin deacetylase (PgdA/CDA1 family)
MSILSNPFNQEKDEPSSSLQFSSVGVDVDQISHYYRIHDLPTDGPIPNANASWEVAIPRFMDLFEEVGIKGTFYCVGADVENHAGNQALLKEMVKRGHEIGNHSWHHYYDLTGLDEDTQMDEVQKSKEILEYYAGTKVVGFRAPGYHSNGILSTAAKESGHLYESSAFPCSSYYLAKALVMGIMKLRGQNSKAILGNPTMLLAPKAAYVAKIDQPYHAITTLENEDLCEIWEKEHLPKEIKEAFHHGLFHFPISVFLEIPLIGTAFSALGKDLSKQLIKLALKSQRQLTVEFHSVDLLSLMDDGLDARLGKQNDLNWSVAKKRECAKVVLEALHKRSKVVTLSELVGKGMRQVVAG